MFDKYPSRNKWVVLGDMVELGENGKEEHEKWLQQMGFLSDEDCYRYMYEKTENGEISLLFGGSLEFQEYSKKRKGVEKLSKSLERFK